MRKLKKKSDKQKTVVLGKKKQKNIREKAQENRPKRLLKSKKVRNGGTDTSSGKKKLRKRYKKQKCAFIMACGTQCNRYAVGKSTLCKKHGGNPIDKDNLIHSQSALIPTKFNPAVHPLSYVDMARHGLSDVEIAAQFEVSMETLANWCETFMEMASAYEIGQAMYEAYFLREGRRNLQNTRFNTSLFKFLTMNKLGYSDKVETKNQNQNMNVGVLLVPDRVSVDEWEANNVAEDEKKNQAKEEPIDAEYSEV